MIIGDSWRNVMGAGSSDSHQLHNEKPLCGHCNHGVCSYAARKYCCIQQQFQNLWIPGWDSTFTYCKKEKISTCKLHVRHLTYTTFLSCCTCSTPNRPGF